MRDDLPKNPECDPLLGIRPVLTKLLGDTIYQSSNTDVTRGLSYYREDRVKQILRENEEYTQFTIEVQGNRLYNVFIDLKPPPSHTALYALRHHYIGTRRSWPKS